MTQMLRSWVHPSDLGASLCLKTVLVITRLSSAQRLSSSKPLEFSLPCPCEPSTLPVHWHPRAAEAYPCLARCGWLHASSSKRPPSPHLGGSWLEHRHWWGSGVFCSPVTDAESLYGLRSLWEQRWGLRLCHSGWQSQRQKHVSVSALPRRRCSCSHPSHSLCSFCT